MIYAEWINNGKWYRGVFASWTAYHAAAHCPTVHITKARPVRWYDMPLVYRTQCRRAEQFK